jgi:hypothetical protein
MAHADNETKHFGLMLPSEQGKVVLRRRFYPTKASFAISGNLEIFRSACRMGLVA